MSCWKFLYSILLQMDGWIICITISPLALLSLLRSTIRCRDLMIILYFPWSFESLWYPFHLASIFFYFFSRSIYIHTMMTNGFRCDIYIYIQIHTNPWGTDIGMMRKGARKKWKKEDGMKKRTRRGARKWRKIWEEKEKEKTMEKEDKEIYHNEEDALATTSES